MTGEIMDTVLVKFAGIDAEFTVSKVLDLGFTEVRSPSADNWHHSLRSLRGSPG